MRHCFEGCLATVLLAGLDCTSAVVETHTGGQEKERWSSQPDKAKCGLMQALFLQQTEGLPPAVPLDLASETVKEAALLPAV